MITASHLPFNRNGFKFFDSKAGFEKKEISDLLKRSAAAAAEGDLSEDDSFPRDKRQAEDAEVRKLVESFKSDESLIRTVNCLSPKPLGFSGQGSPGLGLCATADGFLEGDVHPSISSSLHLKLKTWDSLENEDRRESHPLNRAACRSTLCLCMRHMYKHHQEGRRQSEGLRPPAGWLQNCGGCWERQRGVPGYGCAFPAGCRHLWWGPQNIRV